MSARRRQQHSDPGLSRPKTLQKQPTAEHSRRRLESLYEISQLFIAFDSIERTVDSALAVAARALPIASAVLIEEWVGESRIIVWPSQGRSPQAMAAARANAERVYASLRGLAPDEVDARVVEEAGATFLPRPPESELVVRDRAIVIPLVIGGRPIFGAFQLEATGSLDESDVMFVNAVTNLLAVALDRRHAWDRDVTRRGEAEAREARTAEQLHSAEAITASLGEGVVAVDVDGRVTFANAAAARMLDTTEERAPGEPISELLREVHASGGDGIEHLVDQVLRTGRPARRDEDFLGRNDGRKRSVRCAIAPLASEGAVAGAVIGLEDITERRAAEEDQAILLEATKILVSVLDLPATLAKLAHGILPRLGEVCFVDLLEGTQMVRAVTAHVDRAREEHLARSVTRQAELDDHPAAEAVRCGKSALVSGAVDVWLARALIRVDHRELLYDLRASSLLMVPMSVGVRKLGTITFVYAESGRRHTQADVALAEELARRTAFAVENGRLYAQAVRQTSVREQILGVVSHDLRSPLNAIALAAAVLAESRVAEEDEAMYRHSIGALERSLSRAGRLIDDLLDFASLEAGRLSIQLHVLDPSIVLREARDSLEPVAAAKKVRVEVECEPAIAYVRADRDRVLQVFSNLVANATKVSRPGARIELRAATRGKDVVFSVTDSGPGISKADLAHLFELYWRSREASYKGTGLGLAIAQGIVAAHGGRIWAESTLGVGSTFFFTLPVYGSPPPSSDRPSE